MTVNQQTDAIKESEPEIFACSACGAEWDANNLFVRELSQLAQIKGEEDGEDNAFITPEDLPRFAVCEECSDEDSEPYTLAESIASALAYQNRHRGRNKPGFKHSSNKARPQATVTDAELKELVSCFHCESLGKESSITRDEAMAPAWTGCNIVMAFRQQEANQLEEGVSITSENLSTVGYVTSADLLQRGKDGFVICAECADTVIMDLQEKALGLGFSADEVDAKIQMWALVPMIKSVRRKEKKSR